VKKSTFIALGLSLTAILSGALLVTVNRLIDDDTAPHAGDALSETEASRRILYYRNPMGAPDISPVPRKDPMGMDYIPVYEAEAAAEAGTLRLTTQKIQRTGVRTETVRRRVLARATRAVGTVVADETRLSYLTAKFDGFVEELYVRYTGAEIAAGQEIMRVWLSGSDILQKQSDYLVALRGGDAHPGELKRTIENLRLFDIPDEVIADLKQSGEPVRSIVLRAPTSGTVLEKAAVDGLRFSAGDMLFKVADLTSVWIMAQVAERDFGVLTVGDIATVELRAFPGETIEGRLTFIYPDLNVATRTAMARIEVTNEGGHLKLGQYADVTFRAQPVSQPVIAVPASAIIDSGTRQVALVTKGDGAFEPRDVVLGQEADGYVEIREGLSEGEEIVVSGNFLIDAESNLRAALTAFTPGQDLP